MVDLHRHVLVEGRHLALPVESYARLQGFTDANDTWIRVGIRRRSRRDRGRAGSGRARGSRRGCALVHERHRHRRAQPRRATDQPPRIPAGHQARPDVRAGLRRGRGRRRARGRLSEGPPRRGGAAALGRAVLAHPAEGRPLGPQPHRDGALRRRRGSRGTGRLGARRRWTGHRGDPQRVLPGHRGRDGVANRREWLSRGVERRGAPDGAQAPAGRRRRAPRRASPRVRRHRGVGDASGWAEGAGGHGGHVPARAGRARSRVGEPAAGRAI